MNGRLIANAEAADRSASEAQSRRLGRRRADPRPQKGRRTGLLRAGAAGVLITRIAGAPAARSVDALMPIENDFKHISGSWPLEPMTARPVEPLTSWSPGDRPPGGDAERPAPEVTHTKWVNQFSGRTSDEFPALPSRGCTAATRTSNEAQDLQIRDYLVAVKSGMPKPAAHKHKNEKNPIAKYRSYGKNGVSNLQEISVDSGNQASSLPPRVENPENPQTDRTVAEPATEEATTLHRKEAEASAEDSSGWKADRACGC